MTRQPLWTAALIMLMLAAPGCSQPKENSPASAHATVNIVTSFYPLYIMALNLTQGVTGLKVDDLAPPTLGCLHDYAPTTAEMRRLADADIFITNGAGMEGFLDQVAAQYPRLKIARLSAGLPLITEKGQANPHVWVSVTLAMREVENLAKALAAFDPPHASAYQKNARTYLDQLAALRATMQTRLSPFRGAKIITFHEAFPYFAQEFGLTIAAVVEREPGSAPSAQELAQTIELIHRTHVKALFSEPQYPSQSAGTIARETGLKVYELDPAATGPNRPDAYIQIMQKNLTTLTEALK